MNSIATYSSKVLAALGFAIILSATAPTHASAVVKINDARVRLGDLSATLPHGLEVIDVGPAPAPGKRARITRAGVKSALRRAGADPRLADAMPTITEIERAAKVVEVSTLTQQIAQSLAPKLPKGVKLVRINSVPELVLPMGPHTVQTRLGPLASSMSVTVNIKSQGVSAGSFPVQILLSGTPKIPVLTKKIKRNSIVKKNQVRMQPTRWSQVSSRSALFPEQLIGKRAQQTLQPGQTLTRSAVAKPPVIARGHEISVSASGQGIQIILPATAQEDGAMGQYIRVRPKNGTRTLRAKVVSPNEVHIKLETFR